MPSNRFKQIATPPPGNPRLAGLTEVVFDVRGEGPGAQAVMLARIPGQGDLAVKSLTFIPSHDRPSRSLWVSADRRGNKRAAPRCSSHDLVTGYPRVGIQTKPAPTGLCSTCPYSAIRVPGADCAVMHHVVGLGLVDGVRPVALTFRNTEMDFPLVLDGNTGPSFLPEREVLVTAKLGKGATGRFYSTPHGELGDLCPESASAELLRRWPSEHEDDDDAA